MERLDSIVIGAGVVGLAVARALALRGHEVAILEAEDRIGSVTSARNSEVIHAGIYYPKGSLKARLCVEGRDRLYAYAAEKDIPHKRLGKIIVARNANELPALGAIRDKAAQNGVTDLRPLDLAELREMEPALAGVGGLLSPSTGIIDSHAYMAALLGDAEAGGAMLALRNRVTGLRKDGSGLTLTVESDDEGSYEIAARTVVNAAGLGAWDVARACAGIDAASIPPRYFAKGCYFRMSGPSPFSRLIYPVPVQGGLGTHLTLNLAGEARFGPDVHWQDDVEYGVDGALEASFRAAIEGYYPGIAGRTLNPDFAGVRPKVTGPGEPAGDFIIQGTAAHGIPGLINLFGIESPGLTSSLALADHVAGAL